MASVQLYIDPALVPRAETAQSGAFLIGGYAGWSNFGDYLQLKSTLDLHAQVGAQDNLYILLDARAKEEHERNSISLPGDCAHLLPVYYHSEDDGPRSVAREGLVALPRVPSSMLIHVYGGGFINNWWGRSVRLAIGTLIHRHGQDNLNGQLRLFMSGLQVSPSDEANAWSPLFVRAEYVGARDEETLAILKDLGGGDGSAKLQYSGDDSLLALATGPKGLRRTEPKIAAHVNLAHYSSSAPDGRLRRIAAVLAAAARHFGTELTCDLLVAYPSDRVGEDKAARQLEALYRDLTATDQGPPLTFRPRNIFKEAVDGTFRLDASFLVTCSYHVALTGLLSSCPTLLMVENNYYRQKAAGLSDAFQAHRFAALGVDDDVSVSVSSLFQEKTNGLPGNSFYAMWVGQTRKALCLSSLSSDMERVAARSQLELTTQAFRDVAAQLGEIRKRRILEERLAKEAADFIPIKISSKGLIKYLKASYWRNRRSSWKRSIWKRFDKRTQ